VFGSEPAPNESKSLPVELMGRTPRSVRLTGTGWLYASAWAFFLVLGVVIAIRFVREAEKEKAKQAELQQTGVESLGQVTDKRYTWASPLVSYSFSVDGTTYFGKAEGPVDICDSLHVGEALPIRSLPDDPKFNHPAAWAYSPTSMLWVLWFPVFLSFFRFLFIRRFPKQRRLAINGVPAWARIAEREWTGPTRGSHSENYTFRNANGEEEFGKCEMDVYLKAGATVCVLYLPT
jgi:hypothetical protein